MKLNSLFFVILITKYFRATCVQSLFGLAVVVANLPSAALAEDLALVVREGVTKHQLMDMAISSPRIQALTYYVGWQNIEPQQGKYRWELIDRTLTIAKQQNKKINIGVLPGRWTPEWVYGNGAKPFYYTSAVTLRGLVNKKYRSVRPWDEVYLNNFSDFVAKFGDRYKNNASVGYIAVTGPEPGNGLETNIAVSNPLDFDNMGFDREKFIAAWRRMIDVYTKAFPKNDLALALHMASGAPRSNGVDLLTQVDRISIPLDIRNYAANKLGNRISFMLLGLDDELLKKTTYLSLLDGIDGNRIGLQGIRIFSTGNSEKDARIWGALCKEMQQVENRIHPRWIEFWAEDYDLVTQQSCFK